MRTKHELEVDDHVDITVWIDDDEIMELIPIDIEIVRDLKTMSFSVDTEELSSIIQFLINVKIEYIKGLQS